MILAGNKSKEKITNEEVAKLTLECLKSSVPSEVPGIAFLSGGQSEIEATENLNLINKHNNTNFIMSYSYGRALQQGALKSVTTNSCSVILLISLASTHYQTRNLWVPLSTRR